MKGILLFITLILYIFNLEAIDFDKTISCEKGEIYLLENLEEEKMNEIKRNFKSLKNTCSWGEMINLNIKEKCENFKTRKFNFNIDYKKLIKNKKELTTIQNQWVKYEYCSNSLRFDAIDFKKTYQIKIKEIEKIIKQYKECKSNIEYNKKINCIIDNKQIKKEEIKLKSLNSGKKEKLKIVKFNKYKKKKNPFKKYIPKKKKNPFHKNKNFHHNGFSFQEI